MGRFLFVIYFKILYNKDMKHRRIRLILLTFWLILAGLIVWFKVVPLGHITYSLSYPAKINLLGGKGFIGRFTPVDRVTFKAGQLAKISGDPVYFSISTPRTFSKAKITVTYQDNLTSATPIVSAGVLVDNIVWRYKLAPLQNSLLDNNFRNWQKLQWGDTLLLQKTNHFSSVSEFLTALKDKSENICHNQELKSCLILYNTDDLVNYFPENKTLSLAADFKPITTPLQGTHQFYFTVVNNKEQQFAFNFTDLNLDAKADQVIISIYKGDNKVYSKTITDNFGGEGSGKIRNFSDSFSLPNNLLLPGLYKLEIKASDDIVIKEISKAPSTLNIIGRVHPVASNKALSFWTDSSFIQVTTNNPASLQTIKYGNKTFSLSAAYEPFEFSNLENGIKEISLNHDDVILGNDGVFSLAPTDFFNPEFKQLDRHFVASNTDEYILAKYQSPTTLSNGFKQATVILDTQEAYREKGKYSFILSVPGLSLENKGNIMVKEIKVEFSGRTLGDKIKEKIHSYVN